MNKVEYTEFDLLSFAVYRRFHGNANLDNYKNLMDCFYDWKEKRNHEVEETTSSKA